MTIHDATEVAYKNGYAAGKRDAMKWIPVTERLPEFFVQVLLWDDIDGDVFCGELYGNDNWFVARFDGEAFNFTHWMPLPEPPKEDA